MMRTRIFVDRKGTHQEFYVAIAHGIIGFVVATIAWCLSTLEDELVMARLHAL